MTLAGLALMMMMTMMMTMMMVNKFYSSGVLCAVSISAHWSSDSLRHLQIPDMFWNSMGYVIHV